MSQGQEEAEVQPKLLYDGNSHVSGLIVTVEGKCVQLNKVLKICKYFHNNVGKMRCCPVTVLSVLDPDGHPRLPYKGLHFSTEGEHLHGNESIS